MSRFAHLLGLVLLAFAPAGALAQDIVPGPDGRLLGHFPYPEADPRRLVPPPRGIALGQPCLLQPPAARALGQLIEAADAAPGAAGGLHALSCYRSIAHQRAVFCRRKQGCGDVADRARESAPPGYSEHATGYALDFGFARPRGCADLNPCVAATPAGQWLLANAPAFGFELSFPEGNAQGVVWEPWHWRWVGRSETEPGAVEARMIFARARATFPARPGLPDAALPIGPTAPPEPLAPVEWRKRR